MSNKLDHSSRNFTATIKIDTSIDAPTVIFAMAEGRGEPWYPNGYIHGIKDEDGHDVPVEVSNEADSNHFMFQVKGDKYHGKNLKVNIVPK